MWNKIKKEHVLIFLVIFSALVIFSYFEFNYSSLVTYYDETCTSKGYECCETGDTYHSEYDKTCVLGKKCFNSCSGVGEQKVVWSKITSLNIFDWFTGRPTYPTETGDYGVYGVEVNVPFMDVDVNSEYFYIDIYYYSGDTPDMCTVYWGDELSDIVCDNKDNNYYNDCTKSGGYTKYHTYTQPGEYYIGVCCEEIPSWYSWYTKTDCVHTSKIRVTNLNDITPPVAKIISLTQSGLRVTANLYNEDKESIISQCNISWDGGVNWEAVNPSATIPYKDYSVEGSKTVHYKCLSGGGWSMPSVSDGSITSVTLTKIVSSSKGCENYYDPAWWWPSQLSSYDSSLQVACDSKTATCDSYKTIKDGVCHSGEDKSGYVAGDHHWAVYGNLNGFSDGNDKIVIGYHSKKESKGRWIDCDASYNGDGATCSACDNVKPADWGTFDLVNVNNLGIPNCNGLECWVRSGENNAFGEYPSNYANGKECCGDDKDEYFINYNGVTACCNNPNDILDANGNCIFGPWCSGTDMNHDGEVDISDMGVVTNHYNEQGCSISNSWCSNADLNYDGKVNDFDINIIKNYFGLEGCTSGVIIPPLTEKDCDEDLTQEKCTNTLCGSKAGIKSGESLTHGGYTQNELISSPNKLECCGDDEREIYVNGICCNSANKVNQNGICVGVECNNDNECPADGYLNNGLAWCSSDKKLYRTYRNNSCFNPGLGSARCGYIDVDELVQDCIQFYNSQFAYCANNTRTCVGPQPFTLGISSLEMKNIGITNPYAGTTVDFLCKLSFGSEYQDRVKDCIQLIVDNTGCTEATWSGSDSILFKNCNVGSVGNKTTICSVKDSCLISNGGYVNIQGGLNQKSLKFKVVDLDIDTVCTDVSGENSILSLESVDLNKDDINTGEDLEITVNLNKKTRRSLLGVYIDASIHDLTNLNFGGDSLVVEKSISESIPAKEDEVAYDLILNIPFNDEIMRDEDEYRLYVKVSGEDEDLGEFCLNDQKDISITIKESSNQTIKDRDRDGYTSLDYNGTDCNDNDILIFPGAQELCDNKDNNCNGQIDENLTRTCGQGICAGGAQTCTLGKWSDCSTNNKMITEVAGDGKDNDCDGQIDEKDGQGGTGGGGIVDSDSDNLPDTWEIKYFGGLDVSNGSGDFDGDGVNDYDEYKKNKDPTLPDKTNWKFILIIALVVVLIILVILYFSFKKPSAKSSNIIFSTRARNINQLHDYVRKALSRGYPKHKIREILLKKGWKLSEIEEAFRKSS